MMDCLMMTLRAGGALALVAAWCAVGTAQVPLDGYFPLVGIGLTDEFNDDFSFFPEPSSGVSGNLLGPNGQAHYDLALLDTGAGFSLFTDQAFDDFNLGGSYPGEPDGYQGTEFVTIGGATGQLLAPINDPLGLYVGGLQDRTSAGAALTMNNALLQGQTNTATLTFPPDSDLPNVVGLPFASQYATRISSDAPQVFELGGKTIRTPSIDFLPLGSGGGDIVRKAPLNLNPGEVFAQPPAYLLNILDFDIDKPQENPSSPTLTQGGLFLNVQAENDGGDLGGTTEFFFDTGASVTVVSELNALNLGFDVLVDEPEFTISVVGSGGVLSDIPGFFVEEFTIVALGGSITATNVPVIVLDVADPSSPSNVVEGIVGTNLLSGRNVVIDPNPSLGGGGESAGVYISDPVTNDFTWTSMAASAPWSAAASWDAAAQPDLLSVADVRHTSGGDQEAVVAGQQEAWSLNVGGGAGGETMTVRIENGAKLTTFSGATVEAGGVIALEGGTLDVQYLDVRGGRLTGEGVVSTGSGPIVGQVESLTGSVAPGEGVGTLEIEGRFSLGENATTEFEIGGLGPGTSHDQLVVRGEAALGGALEVGLLEDGFIPAYGDQFDLITYETVGGQFDSIDLPEGFVWELTYGDTALVLQLVGYDLPGDFNGDGSVDAADYTVWRDRLGAPFTQADYNVWQNNYSATAGATLAVPEPTAALLLVLAAIAAPIARRVRAGSGLV